MRIASAVGLGLAFGSVGAVAWALLAYFSGLLVGPLAYGIGWGAGRGVHLGGGRVHGAGPATLAMTIAAVCFALAKFLALVIATMRGTTIVDWMQTFFDQWDLLDLLWLGLALYPAYRIGSRGDN